MAADKVYLLELIELRNACIEYQARIDIALAPYQTNYPSQQIADQRTQEIKSAPIKTQLFDAFLQDLYKHPLLKEKLDSLETIFKNGSYEPSASRIEDFSYTIFAHLFVSRIILTQAIKYMDAEILLLKTELDKEEADARNGLLNKTKEPKENSSNTGLLGGFGSSKEKNDTNREKEKKIEEIREVKKESLSRNKQLFLEFCKIHGIPVDAVDLKTLDTIAFNKSIIRTSDASFFSTLLERNPRLWNKLKNNEYVKGLAFQYITERADTLKSDRSLRSYGYTINVGDDTKGAIEFVTNLNSASRRIQQFGIQPEVLEKAITNSGRDFEDQIKELQATIDSTESKQELIAEAKKNLKQLQVAQGYRNEIIKGSYWSNSEKERKQTWNDSGLFTDATIPEELPLSADELPGFLADQSLLELMGSQASQPNESEPSPSETGVAQEQAPSRRGGINTSDIKRAKQVAQVASKVAANPVAMGTMGIAVGAGGAFALGLSQGAATAAGAGTIGAVGGIFGAVGGGAAGGALLGSVIGPLGTVIGAFGGGIVGGLGFGLGSIGIHIGDYSIAANVGNSLYGIPLNPLEAAGGNISSLGPTIQSATQALGQTTAAAGSNAATVLPTAASSIGQSAGNIAVNATANALRTGANLLSALPGSTSSIFTGAGAMGTVIGGISIGVGTTAIIAATSLYSTFLTDDRDIGQTSESKYITMEKIANPKSAKDPVSVEYTITVTAKDGYTISITNVQDMMITASLGTPKVLSAPQETLDTLKKTVASGESVTATYTVPYDSSYADTRITNTVTIKYDVSGVESIKDQELASIEIVSFGNPPQTACWPTTGVIAQGPFGIFSHAPPGNSYNVFLDAVDIANSTGTVIYAPFSGTVSFYDMNKTSEKCAGGGYGNCAILGNSSGGFIFGHMTRFYDGFESGKSYPIEIGKPIGYMGSTGNSAGPHLHYEYRTSANSGAFSSKPTSSFLQTLLPEPIQYGTTGDVTHRQYVSALQCGSGESGGVVPGEVAKIGCFHLVNGDETWGHTDNQTSGVSEIQFTVLQLANSMSDPRMKNMICKNGDIQIVRKKAGYPDGGCKIGQGSSGGYVDSAKAIYLCDKTFLDKTRFGANTLWHEPGHIVQNKFANEWKTYFSDRKTTGYIPSYPAELGRKYVEDFSEAWGMCNKTRIDHTSGYRDIPGINYQTEPYASAQCKDIEMLLDALGK